MSIVVSRDIAKIARMSCINRSPIIILPCKLSNSFLSERILITTIVLLNTTMSAIYIASIGMNPNMIMVRNVIPNNIRNCIRPPIVATGPISLSFFRSSSSPTVNNKNAIPISDKVNIISLFSTIPSIGPNRNPAKMYAGINGCFRSLATYPKTVASIRIIPISKNTVSI